MASKTTETPSQGADVPKALTNGERLRSHLASDGLANTLMDAWKKDDSAAQEKMLAALHNFHKPK